MKVKIKFITTVLFLLNSFAFSQVRFDADFESGNINTVSTSDSITYNVTTKTDIGGRWFYFRITGVKNRYVRVNVTSSDVKRAVYSYDNRNFFRFSSSESPQTNVFQKTYTEDTVFVAYYTPYNYSFLQERIAEWQQSPYVRVDTLGFTLRNFPIQEVRVTDPFTSDSLKQHIWVHARTHPGETPSSWQFDGFMEALLSDNEVIQFYREKFVFHCVPFTNPDGVFYGRSRTNFDGVDVESNWNKPDNQTCQEVKILKQRMATINNVKPLVVFQNLHSQASPFCTFWIHTAASTSNLFYRKEHQFCNLNTSDNPYFTQSDYSYSSLSAVFPEGWLWANWGEQVMALTYETPYDYYSTGELVTLDALKYKGKRLLYSIAEYLEASHPKHLILDNKSIASNWSVSSSGTEFYSDNFLYTLTSSNRGPIAFNSGNLEKGKYDVYGWWQSSSSNAYDTKFIISGGGNNIEIQKSQKLNGGQWNYLTQVNLPFDGNISITVSDTATGTIVADAFRLIYAGLPTSVDEPNINKDFVLYQNYPNPFNPSTIIRFSLNKTDEVRLIVFNVLGEKVAELVNGVLSQGIHEVVFNSSLYGIYSSGIYYYRLTTSNYSETKGMLFIK